MKEPWWVSGPVFSVSDHGGRITVLPPGENVGRLDLGLLLRMVGTAGAWLILMILSAPRTIGPVRSEALQEMSRTWWWLVLLAGAAVLMMWSTAGLFAVARRIFRQLDIAFVMAACAACAGFGAGMAIDAAIATASPVETTDGVISLFFIAAALLGFAGSATWLPFTVARARRRGRAIARLRERGRRLFGTVVSIGRMTGDIGGFTQFRDTRIVYRDGDAERDIAVAMSATPSRVPLPGFGVVVFTDGVQVHIEPDREVPVHLDPDSEKYRHTADGGGG